MAREVDRGERVVVGVNRYVLDTEEPYEPLRVDPAIEAAQAERLARSGPDRDGAAVTRRWRSCGRQLAEPPTYWCR